MLLASVATLLTSATMATSMHIEPRASSKVAYYDPTIHNGSMLTIVEDTYPSGLGEPINVIVSGLSDSRVLGEYWLYWMGSIGFSGNCLGAASETKQKANLGDGNGALNETAVMRWNYGNYNFGSCTETVDGGNHFRYWVQNGNESDSGAIFMAVSYEKNLANGHDIIADGYDAGRDQLVANATQASGTSFRGVSFNTTSVDVTGLLSNGSDGINHYISIDGIVKLLTIEITNITDSDSTSSTSSATSAATYTITPTTYFYMTIVAALFSFVFV